MDNIIFIKINNKTAVILKDSIGAVVLLSIGHSFRTKGYVINSAKLVAPTRPKRKVSLRLLRF